MKSQDKPPRSSSVRIKPAVHQKASEVAALANYSLAQVIELCLEDCLEAIDTGKPIMPRIAKIARALKAK
jgi:hypothetical protein